MSLESHGCSDGERLEVENEQFDVFTTTRVTAGVETELRCGSINLITQTPTTHNANPDTKGCMEFVHFLIFKF